MRAGGRGEEQQRGGEGEQQRIAGVVSHSSATCQSATCQSATCYGATCQSATCLHSPRRGLLPIRIVDDIAGKGVECRGRPLPNVAHHLPHAPRRVASGERVHRK